MIVFPKDLQQALVESCKNKSALAPQYQKMGVEILKATDPTTGRLEALDYVKSLCPDACLNAPEVPKGCIFVPSKKMVFDYTGLLWGSSFPSMLGNFHFDCKAHMKKALACKEAGLNYFMFWEDEWHGEKREIVKGMIRWRLGAFNGTKLPARSLELRRLDNNKQFKEFFKKAHLDGHTNAMYAYGLFQGDKLIMAATVRHNHASEYEIGRMATDQAYSVPGGASRLWAAIRKEVGDIDIYSYSNNRLSQGGVYDRTGYEWNQDNAPSYYYTDGETRSWRYKCKRVNLPEIMAVYPTEISQAVGGVYSQKIHGDDRPLFKIYDCAHVKHVMKAQVQES